MTRTDWIDTGVLLLLGAAGGTLAAWIGVPMPYMIGSLTFSAAYTIAWGQLGREVAFPRPLRFFFVGVIGVMIGSRFTPDLLPLFPVLWPSFLAVTGFVVVSHAYGYFVLRGLGRYDRTTATYGAMPGGLIEAITMGEKAGADVKVLTVQHFARIILVVVTVPMLFLWLGGEAVGSSAGQALDNGPSAWTDLVLIAVLAPAGLWVGRRLHLPAGQLMGPLVVCGGLQLAGAVALHPPPWLLWTAQLVVGAGLGAQFAGASGRVLGKAFGLGLVSVAGMLVIGAGVAAGLTRATPEGFEPLFVSFAPGGMTEMALIALSLDASPVIVTAHHLARIMFAVVMVGWVSRRIRRTS
ncbi:AbrB family transcriptional regulator [Psychromarinibacter sp. C21-152]|uniref:AbrB family transcriptional regulator n=1 Tax=Psychromarinibacter sediminicola TaxID=3033385 RepID=A0AAE3TBY3_9RHOB|nr:AbrB family transcriptional regulator [Psychromarinibacter sediminicola]MDF0603085.1 AbrB family transcriptional regulator [Psychromarinibacter sediminicola]